MIMIRVVRASSDRTAVCNDEEAHAFASFGSDQPHVSATRPISAIDVWFWRRPTTHLEISISTSVILRLRVPVAKPHHP
jgi:hypothetical protein